MPVARLTKVETWHKCMNCSKKFSSTWWSDLVKHDAPCGFRVFINFTRISAACLAVENGLQLINNKPQASSSEQLLVNIIRDFTHDHCPGSWPAISSDISDLAWISPTWTAVYIIYIYGCHVCRMSLFNKHLVTSSDITYNNSPRISCVFATNPAFCQDTHEAHRAVVVLCPKESPPCVFSRSWHCHGHLRWMNQQNLLDFIAYESWTSISWCFRCHPTCYPWKIRKNAQQSQVQAQSRQQPKFSNICIFHQNT